MNVLQRLFILLLAFSCASRSEALVNAEISMGRKSMTGIQTYPTSGTTGSMAGTSATLDAHIQPSPLIPLGIGAFYSSDKLSKSGDSKLTWSQNTGGLSLYTWVPVMITTLYMKLGYNVLGSSAVKASSSDSASTGISESSFSKGKISGYRICAGVAYPLFALTSLNLSYNYARETHLFRTVESTRASDGSTATSSLDDAPTHVNVSASTVALGLSVNL